MAEKTEKPTQKKLDDSAKKDKFQGKVNIRACLSYWVMFIPSSWLDEFSPFINLLFQPILP